jgi:ABC-type amino acid transport substrate-binding protein
VKGSTAEAYLVAHDSKVSSFDTIADAYDSLDKGDVVAVVYDKPILQYHLKNGGSAGQSVVGLFQRQNYGIGLQNKSPYRKQINAVLLGLEEDGTIDDLRTKWFGDDE